MLFHLNNPTRFIFWFFNHPRLGHMFLGLFFFLQFFLYVRDICFILHFLIDINIYQWKDAVKQL